MLSRRWNSSQRVVAVITLAIVLYLVGDWLTSTLMPEPIFGWVAYAPLSGQLNAPLASHFHPLLRLLIWLVLTVAWSVASIALLREGPENDAAKRLVSGKTG